MKQTFVLMVLCLAFASNSIAQTKTEVTKVNCLKKKKLEVEFYSTTAGEVQLSLLDSLDQPPLFAVSFTAQQGTNLKRIKVKKKLRRGFLYHMRIDQNTQEGVQRMHRISFIANYK